jgi:transcriptional regulator with XRE-family HTH domain
MQYLQDDSIDNMEIICTRMDSIRRQVNMTQKEFAEALDISQSAVSKYLNGRMPPADVMLKIARLGFTNVEWILTGKIPPLIVENNIVKEENTPYGTADFTTEYGKLPPALRRAIQNIISHARQHDAKP